MKKVFLSLAFVAALTVVSCKQADANAEATTEAIDSTADVATEMIDSTADVAVEAVDSAAAEVTSEAPKAE
jgi:hypothetical protein